MMTRGESIPSDVQPASPNQGVTVDPNPKRRRLFPACERHEHRFNNLPPVCGGVEQRSEEHLWEWVTVWTPSIRPEEHDGRLGHLHRTATQERQPRSERRPEQG